MNINYLLKDWAWRVNDGMPDPKNRNHLELLEATLRDHKYSEEFISAYITSIKEVGGHKYIKRTGTAPNYKYTYPEDGGTKGAKKKDEDESDKKTPETKTKTFPKKAKDKEWTGVDSPDGIIDAVSTKKDPPVKEVKSPKQAKERQDKHREGVFQGKITGKGGGQTTVQEEITNIGRDITINNPDIAKMSKEEQVEAIMEEIKKIPGWDEKWSEEDLRTLAEKSTAGINTAETINSNKKQYNYAEKQPEGYPINTTDGIIVRDIFSTQLKEAEESGDPERIKHAKQQLYRFQKRAGDKSITGHEGDADTMVVYKDEQGNDRVIFITNKQSLDDQLSSSTVTGTKNSINESAERMDLTDTQKETVDTIVAEQHEKATQFDEEYISNSKKTYDENKEVMSTPQAKSTTSKLASGITKRSIFGKKESELTPEALQEKKEHVNKLKTKPEVQAKLMGAEGPPNNDPKSKEYKDWAKKTKDQYKDEGKDYPQEDVVNAGLETNGTGGMKTGSHNRTVEKIVIGIKDIRAEVKKRMDKQGMSKEEAYADVAKSIAKGRKNKKTGEMEYKYGGEIKENDIKEIVENEGYTKMIEDDRIKKESISKMQTETTARLLTADSEEGFDPPNTKTGPRTQTYTDGYFSRTHVREDILGENDNDGFMEAGENSLSPQEKRAAYAEEFGFDSEDDWNEKYPDGKDKDEKTYGERLYQHMLDNTFPEGEDQKIYYISKIDGKKKVIGRDTHRTAGNSSKVAGQYGKPMQEAFKRVDKKSIETMRKKKK